jgi:hypothetical protein
MFRALLAHPQDSLHKRHLVYWVRIMSVDCGTGSVSLQYTMHICNVSNARSIRNAVCTAPPEDEQVMFETRRGL